eukprot:806892-Rhodomonas_salina.3
MALRGVAWASWQPHDDENQLLDANKVWHTTPYARPMPSPVLPWCMLLCHPGRMLLCGPGTSKLAPRMLLCAS